MSIPLIFAFIACTQGEPTIAAWAIAAHCWFDWLLAKR